MRPPTWAGRRAVVPLDWAGRCAVVPRTWAGRRAVVPLDWAGRRAILPRTWAGHHAILPPDLGRAPRDLAPGPGQGTTRSCPGPGQTAARPRGGRRGRTAEQVPRGRLAGRRGDDDAVEVRGEGRRICELDRIVSGRQLQRHRHRADGAEAFGRSERHHLRRGAVHADRGLPAG